MSELIVRMIAAEVMTDLNAYVLALYEWPDGSGERIELQRALSFDDQDHELDQNTYCISLASGATHYGGVRACALHGNRLTLRLSPKGAEELGIDEHVVVEFRVDPDATALVRDGLLKIFADDSDRPEEFAVDRHGELGR
jgi:hypothetical protein